MRVRTIKFNVLSITFSKLDNTFFLLISKIFFLRKVKEQNEFLFITTRQQK